MKKFLSLLFAFSLVIFIVSCIEEPYEVHRHTYVFDSYTDGADGILYKNMICSCGDRITEVAEDEVLVARTLDWTRLASDILSAINGQEVSGMNVALSQVQTRALKPVTSLLGVVTLSKYNCGNIILSGTMNLSFDISDTSSSISSSIVKNFSTSESNITVETNKGVSYTDVQISVSATLSGVTASDNMGTVVINASSNATATVDSSSSVTVNGGSVSIEEADTGHVHTYGNEATRYIGEEGKLYLQAIRTCTSCGDIVEESKKEQENIAFASGNGSLESPFIIADEDDILSIRNLPAEFTDDVYLKLGADIIIDMTQTTGEDGTNKHIVINKENSVVLDFAGKTIQANTASKENLGYFISVYGRLILNDSIGGGQLGGGLDVANSRGIEINSGASVEINDGITIQTFSWTSGSTIYCAGDLVINDVNVYATYFALSGDVGSTVIVNGGKFCSVASNKLNTSYAYVMNLRGNSRLNVAEVHGIQGAISIGNMATLEDGVVAFATKDIFDHVPSDYKTFYKQEYKAGNAPEEPSSSEMFYAMYCAGESSTTAAVTINGGKYFSDGYASVLSGNSADGGQGKEASTLINGGIFNNEIRCDKSNESYGYGYLDIRGGRYKVITATGGYSSLGSYVDPDLYVISTEPDSEGYYTVTAK